MTLDDAEFYTDEQRAEIEAQYPDHERDARTKGVPQLGSGRVFPIAEALISVTPFEIPEYFALIGALDFGWDHPNAAVKLAHDHDDDIVYVTNAYRRAQAVPEIYAAALKPWGDKLPWAWPHDGYQHDKQSGKALKDRYDELGLDMLAEHAQFEAGGTGVEAGLMEMLAVWKPAG